ncbi:hypothetical protein ADK35_42515, partial [Streptomyces viridochromogenes]
PRPEHQKPRRPGPDVPRPPRVEIPDVSESVRKGVQGSPGNAGTPGNGGNGDVCALGKKYGGWQPGSPESKICEQTYGH